MHKILDMCSKDVQYTQTGIINITVLHHQVNKYAKELLAAMSSGMEEKDDPG